MHCQVQNTYMHAKFQRNWPRSRPYGIYSRPSIGSEITELSKLLENWYLFIVTRDTCIWCHSHTSGIIQYLVGGSRDEATLMKRPQVNRSSSCKDISMHAYIGKAPPRPAVRSDLSAILRKTSLARCARSLVIIVPNLYLVHLSSKPGHEMSRLFWRRKLVMRRVFLMVCSVSSIIVSTGSYEAIFIRWRSDQGQVKKIRSKRCPSDEFELRNPMIPFICLWEAWDVLKYACEVDISNVRYYAMSCVQQKEMLYKSVVFRYVSSWNCRYLFFFIVFYNIDSIFSSAFKLTFFIYTFLGNLSSHFFTFQITEMVVSSS